MTGESLPRTRLLLGGTALAGAGRGRLLAAGVDAGLQGIHEIDDARRARLLADGLDGNSRLLALQELDQRLLVVILERLGLEVTGLGIHDMSGELHHLRRQLQLRYVSEVVGLVANLVRIAQR